MEKSLEKLSVSKLRTLLIDEVISFAICLENASPDELDEKKKRLILIYHLLSEKEKLHAIPLVWGKNSPKPASGQSSSHLLPE